MAAPVITAISTTLGPVGQWVYILGSGFIAGTSVYFNNLFIVSDPTIYSATRLGFRFPTGTVSSSQFFVKNLESSNYSATYTVGTPVLSPTAESIKEHSNATYKWVYVFSPTGTFVYGNTTFTYNTTNVCPAFVYSPNRCGFRKVNQADTISDLDITSSNGTAALMRGGSWAPVTPTQIGPSGNSPIDPPVFSFNAVANATDYQIILSNVTGWSTSVWVTATSAGVPAGTGTGTITWGSPLAGGAYKWAVRAQNGVGASSPSPLMGVTLVAPAAPSLLSPTAYAAVYDIPTFTFGASLGAVDYQIVTYRLVSGAVTELQASRWYSAAEAGVANGSGTGSILPSITLNAGDARWYVVARNGVGSNAAAARIYYPTLPGLVYAASPKGGATSVPTFRWTAVTGALEYQITVVNTSTATTNTSPWIASAAAGITGATTAASYLWSGSPLSTGSYIWSIVARNGIGVGGVYGWTSFGL